MIGTTIKLARALWIVPLALAVAVWRKSNKSVRWPWFILLFCLAAIAGTYLPVFAPLNPKLSLLGKSGLTVTLYLIGTGISKSTLKQVGVRPLLQGMLLWAIVASASLALIRYGVIGI
jgi:uncharacterized membrane protein YadS